MKPSPALYPFSLVYGGGVIVRNLFFDVGLFRTAHVAVPVVSVGNLVAGGAGKTPLVDNAAKILLDAGYRVCALSRGYLRISKGLVVVSSGDGPQVDVENAGDEPYMLARRNPRLIVVVDERRVRAARYAVAELHADVIVLDDGFQHRALARTHDIVVIDPGQSPFATTMLPSGYRREPLRALRRAGTVVLTRTPKKEDTGLLEMMIRHYTNAPVFRGDFVPQTIRRARTGFSISTESVRGKAAVAFCGIARPDAFRRTLGDLGVDVREFFSFPDHHRYAEAELGQIAAAVKRCEPQYLLTTEKDVSRLTTSAFRSFCEEQPLFCVEMKVLMHHAEAWRDHLLTVIQRARGQ